MHSRCLPRLLCPSGAATNSRAKNGRRPRHHQTPSDTRSDFLSGGSKHWKSCVFAFCKAMLFRQLGPWMLADPSVCTTARCYHESKSPFVSHFASHFVTRLCHCYALAQGPRNSQEAEAQKRVELGHGSTRAATGRLFVASKLRTRCVTQLVFPSDANGSTSARTSCCTL